ncbi:uncharacterized protein LOC130097034 [Rhinichthys klamathensis goyatoka]|uniref:uncharacterized protein LOC130097034 n=1 Tax=Rhinichthys klamathensis goyatoka TaxID=3034132 RepID=UPI0024B4BA98|nr:uncharacterized protein LOC130097034 [Rhinichthys klamathensis goyatoka]
MDSLEPGLQKCNAIIKQSSVIEEGTPTRYHLTPTPDSHDQSQPYRKMTFGERDKTKPHKTILIVGETGTGKTKLTNTMINYMLDVQREDKVWFEITDDQSDRTSAHSQTSSITVYGFYLQESKTDLTIIDTPGYGETRGAEKEIGMSLLSLIESKRINKIDAVCLVIKATQSRLSDREIYIFDAVQSLFGRDIDENIVLLFTHSRGAIPKNILMAVEEDKIKCAVNEQNQPVYFLFDNCQSEAVDEEYEMLKQSWDLSFRGITGFFKFLDNIKSKTVKMTQDVLQQQKQLEAKISDIKSHIQEIDRKQNELKQTQEDLEKHRKVVEENKNFEYEVEVPYKEKVDIDLSKAKEALCCPVCEENCHYPDSWWARNLSWSSVMKDDHCTVCTNKCHYSKHVKEAKIYETKTKKVKRTYEDLKKKYDDNIIKVREGESLVKRLEEELQTLEKEKIKLVMDAFHCVDTLEKITLNTDSLNTLRHVDFLIEELKEINEPDKAKQLEDIKKRAGEEENRALKYMERCVKSEN